MNDAAAIFDELRRRYREPQRHYHTQRHIHDLLALSSQKRIPVADELTVAVERDARASGTRPVACVRP